MRTLYLECNMGISGDMFLSALLELTDDPAASLDKLNGMGLGGVRFDVSKVNKRGIVGTHTDVIINEQGAHRHLADVTGIINALNIPQSVRGHAIGVYNILAGAEAYVHGKAVNLIHFHEIGQLDAIADITGVCLLINELKPDSIISSPVNTGFGSVSCAHGTLPVPAPATARILTDIPICAGAIEGELTTPTGAALIKYFAKGFCRMPCMTVKKIGNGMGTKDFPAANMLRAYLADGGYSANEEITELACNLDDMTAEALSYAIDILNKNGALDVFTVAAQMKKNRPGSILTCLCRPDNADTLAALMLRHTSTFGVRKHTLSRYALDRSVKTIDTKYGSVRVKVASGYGINKYKPEFCDVAAAALAHDVSVFDINNEVLKRGLDEPR